MTNVRLFSRHKHFVATVQMPPYAQPPEAIRWHERTFLFNKDGCYYEITCVEATSVADREQKQEA